MAGEHLPEERIRASDADRDATAGQLAQALVEGRLDLAEYDKRLAAAMTRGRPWGARPVDRGPSSAPGSARAPVDLAAVGRAHAPARRWRDFLEPWRGFASLAVILGGIWLVTSIMAGELLYFWPGWPLGIVFVITAANALSGSARSDKDTPGDNSGQHTKA